MTTGYTFIIEDGCTFGQFVWHCARAFGAGGPTVHPENKTIEHYDQLHRRERARLRELEEMTEEQAEAAAKAEHEARVAAEKKQLEIQKRRFARYQDMRAHVEAWEPPTDDHYKLKKFMLDQIDMCVEGIEVVISDLNRVLHTEALSGSTWLFRARHAAYRDSEYYEEQLRKVREQVSKNSAWLKALNESVPFEATLEASDD